MVRIALQEWGQPTTVVLTPQERKILGGFLDVLSVEDLGQGVVRLGPNNDHVGSVRLSQATTIVVQPKVSIRNFLELVLLGLGVRGAPLRKDLTLYGKGSAIEWLAILLVREVRNLFRSGIRRGYVPTRDVVPVVRGRIDFVAMSRTTGPSTAIACYYRPFSLDTTENRLLKSGLDFLSRRPLNRSIKIEISEQLATLHEVSSRPLSPSTFANVPINHLNKQYETALKLCELLMLYSGLDDSGAAAAGAGFFVSMNDLFEKALTNAVRQAIPTAVAQKSFKPFKVINAEPSVSVTIVPDITIYRDGTPWLVIDAKYKKPLVKTQFGRALDSGNLYQIMTYAKALQCEGLLVYPKSDEVVNVDLMLDDTRVRITTVDLEAGAVTVLGNLAALIAQNLREVA